MLCMTDFENKKKTTTNLGYKDYPSFTSLNVYVTNYKKMISKNN
jgi:hypothetical protein